MRYAFRFAVFLLMICTLVPAGALACLLFCFVLYPLWMFRLPAWRWAWTDTVLREWPEGMIEFLRTGELDPVEEASPAIFYENWADGLTIEQMYDRLQRYSAEYHQWRAANPTASHYND